MLFKINVYICVCVYGGVIGAFLSIDICFIISFICFGYQNNLLCSCFDVLKMKLFIFII